MVWTEGCAVCSSECSAAWKSEGKSCPSVGLCVFGYCVTVCLREAERTVHGLGGWSHWWSSGFPHAPPGVDVLEGGKLTSYSVADSSHNPLQSFAIAAGAVSIPGSNAASQDAFHSAGVEWVEDVGTHSKFPQAPEEKEGLFCLLQHRICVSRPCEVLSDVDS